MRYFGTDGIRGKYNEFITKELSYKLGRSLSVLGCNKLVVAQDTRMSSDILSKYLISGAMSAGIEVINAGVIPTQALIYYSKINNIFGVMITASHNMYEDNGLKVVKYGKKLSNFEEKVIEEYLDEDIIIKELFELPIDNSVENLYYNNLENFSICSNLKIIIDCANGATFKIAPTIFNNVTNNLIVLADNPNGKNINENVGSTNLNNIIDNFKDYDIAFSFDGDGDRVLVVEDGKIIDGDQIIYLIAKYLKENNALNNNTVVLTMMSNIGILKSLESIGIKYVLTNVGDKYVVKELLENNYSIGGENSGHIILPEIIPTGDGILVSLLLLKIMKEHNCKLSDFLDGIDLYEDKMVNLKVNNKDIIYSDIVQNEINKIQEEIDGKVIVRKSGTENLIRLTVMAKTKKEVDKYMKRLINLIEGE